MARNKYPEVTVERILDAAQRLFLEKGYDNTTIQDIVGELHGLTKGAIYHHFKSKEDIMDALGDRLFYEHNPFDAVQRRTDLNGLEKIRTVIQLAHAIPSAQELSRQSLPLLKNPRILARVIEADNTIIAPRWRQLLEEGIADGSIQTAYPAQIAELFPLLTSLWLLPSVFPATRPELLQKLEFLQDLFNRLGLPFLDAQTMSVVQNAIDHLGLPET